MMIVNVHMYFFRNFHICAVVFIYISKKEALLALEMIVFKQVTEQELHILRKQFDNNNY